MKSEPESAPTKHIENDANEELYQEIVLTLHKDDALDLSVLLDESPVLPDLRGYYEILYEDPDQIPDRGVGDDPDLTRIVFYFAADNPGATASLEILLAARNIESFQISHKSLNKNDYLQTYKKFYQPFAISRRLLIVPSWHKDGPEEKQLLNERGGQGLSLYLDPGLAFGTGQHPTTALCLRRLDETLAPGARMIDAGCGSGILALGAILLGAGEIFAFDVDGNAVMGVRNNAALNRGATEKIQVARGGFELEEFAAREADLMIGNLTENVIIGNAEYIEKGRFNRMILSGVLDEQKESVIERFQDSFTLDFEDLNDGWVLLDFLRKV